MQQRQLAEAQPNRSQTLGAFRIQFICLIAEEPAHFEVQSVVNKENTSRELQQRYYRLLIQGLAKAEFCSRHLCGTIILLLAVYSQPVTTQSNPTVTTKEIWVKWAVRYLCLFTENEAATKASRYSSSRYCRLCRPGPRLKLSSFPL